MKKDKIKKYETEEQKEIKKFVFVLIGLIIVIVGIYYFTRAFVTKDLFKEAEEVKYQAGAVSNDTVIVGTMLNRPYEEYYVIAYARKDNKANYYNTLISKYLENKEALKTYYLDLENELNKKYVATNEEVTKEFKDIENLKLGSFTLIKVKKGKVTKIVVNEEEIKNELNIEKK